MWRELSSPHSRLAAIGISILAVSVAVSQVQLIWVLLAYLTLALVTGPLAVIDLLSHRLPNVITLGIVPIIAFLLLVQATIDGEWTHLRSSLVGAALLTLAFGFLHLIYPQGMGMGDVKLAIDMGLILGWISGWAVLCGMALSFIASAIVGVILLATGRANRKTQIAFGPFMLCATWLVVATQFPP